VARRKEIQERKNSHETAKQKLKSLTKDWEEWQGKPLLAKMGDEGQSEDNSSEKRLQAFVKEKLDETEKAIAKNKDAIESNWKQWKMLEALEKKLLGDKWKSESKLSLLIEAGRDATGSGKGDEEDKEDKEARPETGCNEAHEYFSAIGREPAEALLGRAFTDLLKALQD
jgi:hypothetical protein